MKSHYLGEKASIIAAGREPGYSRNFGNLLEEGIKRVHITRKKPIGYILDEFGYELRPDDVSKGRHALGHWYYKKRIPASMEDVAKLATLIVTNSDVDREWLKAFLDSAAILTRIISATSSF